MFCHFHQGHYQTLKKLPLGDERRGIAQMKVKVAEAVNGKNRKPDKTDGMRKKRHLSKDHKITGTTVNLRNVN